jgi:hypothetical protein
MAIRQSKFKDAEWHGEVGGFANITPDGPWVEGERGATNTKHVRMEWEGGLGRLQMGQKNGP